MGVLMSKEHQTEPSRWIDFYCECSRTDCLQRIPLLLTEFDRIHRDARQVVAKPEHVLPGQLVMERHHQYWVIRRPGSGSLA